MEIDSGNTAWVLTSAALVLLMTPGLALFYGGMARSKSVLNMLMMSFTALGVVSVLWDDSLGVVGVHLVGGLVGTLMIGLVASEGVAGRTGLLLGGGGGLLADQAVAAVAVMAYSFLLTLVIALLIQGTIGLRVSEEEEVTGLDRTVHAESGYELTGTGSGGTTGMPTAAAVLTPR